MAGSIGIGNTVTLTGIFLSRGGQLVDPSTVLVRIRRPDRTEVTYTYGASAIQHPSLGTYTFDLLLNAPGPWSYRFVGDGTAVAAAEATLTCRGSTFTTP